MIVQFYPDYIDSDFIEVPDNITEEELSDMACEWVANNVAGFWRVISGKRDAVPELDDGWRWLEE